MIRFQLLGAIDLRDGDSRELRAVLAQPKRLALLAYLAAASPAGSHRRDTLHGIFWPELDQDHARNSLNKAVHFLRRSLGEGAIVSRSADELALDDAAVWVDVRIFAIALDENRTDEALELYRGDLLPSFFVPEAPGFEEWLERERARLRARAAAAARLLAEQHEAGRHLTLAVACAHRAVELSDGDERPLRRLIELLERVGDRAGAVRAYEGFVRKLAAELDVEPAPETVALIERIRASPPPRPAPLVEPPRPEPSRAPVSRLATALAHRYKVERELGAGAMAVVVLAHDLRHHRRVAIKILRPELASLMGPERFLREIDISASLMHPHILPLHDSGEADGLLYYVMPYVEGESLRGRLERERRLPLEDALQIAREVADALAYAHHRGFVHRDIKPENILLGGGHALVADFGIARAIGSVGQDHLTARRLGTGTPAYMSPEQATGESPVDERTDIYALGCVLYEMLAGEPPFAGRSVEAVMIHRLSAPAPRVSVVRDDISPEIDAAITKSLAHAPAVRFAKAEDFAAILKQGVVATTVAAPAQAAATLVQQGHARSWKRVSVALLALSLLLSGLWALSRGRSMPGRAAPESDAIVVLPFRMLGPDSLLAGLDEGMVDLLATRLSAGANARIIDPRTALAAWRRRVLRDADGLTQQSVLDIAEDLGAGRVITGSIVGAVGEITLVASLLSVPEGTVRSRASLTGRADSLMVLVDRLTAQLISVDAGEAEHRLAALTSTSLPALRAYLEGQAAYRRFLFDRARERFANAVQLDSTFALAALGLRVSLWWGHTRFPPELIERAERLAWTFRNRLNARDELRVRAHLGARYPEWTPPAEQIAFLESVIAIVPDDPELWQVFGYLLFHGGAHLSIPAWRERSSAALRRAIELDSLFLAPRNHLVRLAVEARDTASLRELSTFYSTHAPLEAAEMIAWLASAVGGASMGGQLPALQLGTFREQSLRRVVIESPSFGLRLGDAESALALLYERSASASERERTLLLAREFALNRGRPAEALRAIRELRGASRVTAFRHERLREIVYYALYWDGDQAAGAQAAAELSRVAGLAAPTGTTAFAEHMRARCVLEQWRLSRNDRRTAWQSIGLLHTAAEALPARREAARMQACAALLQALLSSAEKRPDVLRVLDRLDSLHMAGLPDLRNEDVWFCAGNLVAARLRAAHGDLEGALAAIRRRGEPGDQKILLSSYLREEGRLALLAGDTTAAIRAYQHFLALRSHPEPQLVDDAARVRSEVHRLIARSGDN